MNTKLLRKRIISFIVIMALILPICPNPSYIQKASAQQAEPASVLAEPAGQGTTDVVDVIYVRNKGEYVNGYTPAATANKGDKVYFPTEAEIERPGYTFGGWYDNRGFEGEPMIGVTAGDTEVVAYAKWIPRSYKVVIPDTISYVAPDALNVTSEGQGFFEDDEVLVNVQSNYYNNYTFDIELATTQEEVTLIRGNGAAPEIISVDAGTPIEDLPAAEREGYLFMGWCYDSGCQVLAEGDDEVIEDLVLYAKFMSLEDVQPVSYDVTACEQDCNPDFTVTVYSSRNMSVDDFKAAIKVTNATNPEEQDFFDVAGGYPAFIIYGVNGFNPGSTYKIELLDDALVFGDYRTSENPPKEYDFTVAKNDVANATFSNEIKYVKTVDVSNLVLNGEAVQNVSASSVLPVGDSLSGTVSIDGSFRYTNAYTKSDFAVNTGISTLATLEPTALRVGDIVGIFEGDELPDGDFDELIETDSNVSYIEITSIDADGTVHYHGADAKKVLFTPDVFPVPNSADTDGDATNNSVRVPESLFLFTDSKYEVIGLNADTRVEPNDFIAFYTGTDFEHAGDIAEYARITKVDKDLTAEGMFYVLDYDVVTYEEMTASMDAFYSRPLTSDEMLESADSEAQIIDSITEQLETNGFTQQASNYLMLSLLTSEDFREGMLEQNIDPSTLTFVDADGDRIMSGRAASTAGGLAKVEVAVNLLQPYLTTDLAYFKGLEGFRIFIKVGVEVTIHATALTDIKFQVTGEFQQEIRFDIGIDGEAEWDNWGPIPYISDYVLSVNTDIYEYTAFGIEVTVTIEAVSGVPNSKLAKAVDTASSMADTFKTLSESASKVLGTEDDEALSFDLAEKYSEMIDAAGDMDYATVFQRAMMQDRHIRVLKIIDICIGTDFVVSAKVNVTVGNQFYYACAKRFIYTIYVFDKEVTREETDLEPEVYSYTFYAMGMIGIRAGVQLRLAIGLLSTELDSIEIHAQTGAFFEVYGYFYYVYKNSKFNGVHEVVKKYAGALYMEIGIYVNIMLYTQVGGGALAYALELYDHQWPLATFGEQKNIQDFTWDQKDLEEVSMKYSLTHAFMPDNLFTLKYLDLKEGATKVGEGTKDEHYEYPELTPDLSAFEISFTNNKFSYDAFENKVEVAPAEGDRTVDGEMIITYKKAPLTLTSAPIQRRIKLHWDNLASGYLVSFNTMGGSYIPAIEGRYGMDIKVPANPTRKGYTFGGWYVNSSCSQPGTIPETMPSENLIFYANWVPADTEYTVEHYTENLSGDYEMELKESRVATTGTIAAPAPKPYEGFTTPSVQTAMVNADGSTVIRYFYSRKTYTVTFEAGNGTGESKSFDLKYGAKISVPSFGKIGYEFSGWDKPVLETMPAYNVTYRGSWRASSDTPYSVHYYFQNADGDDYELGNTVILKGVTGTVAQAVVDPVDGYHCDNQNVTGVIAADGSTVLRVYYDRNSYKVTYDSNEGPAVAVNPDTKRFGETVFAPILQRADYAFLGWYEVKNGTVSDTKFNDIMPEHDIDLQAGWIKGTGYTVDFYLMDVDGTYEHLATVPRYVQEGEENKPIAIKLLTDEDFRQYAKLPEDYDLGGFIAPAVTTAAITATGMVFTYYYDRHEYTVTIDKNDGSTTPMAKIKLLYGDVIPYKEYNPTRTGWEFTGWKTDKDGSGSAPATVPAGDLTVYAGWNHISYKYVLDYGYGSKVENYLVCYYGDKVTPAPNAVRPGYKFEGWYDANGSKYSWPSTMGDADVTLTAHWTANEYTITYVLTQNSEYNNAPTKYKTDMKENLVINAPTKIPAGYSFDGWEVVSQDEQYPNFRYTINGSTFIISAGSYGNVTIRTKFKGNNVTLSFYNNLGEDSDRNEIKTGKSVDGKTKTAVVGSKFPDLGSEYIPERYGYTFAGYAEQDAAGKTLRLIYGPDGKALNNTVCEWPNGGKLYAVWNTLTYTIKVDTSRYDGSRYYYTSGVTYNYSDDKIFMPDSYRIYTDHYDKHGSDKTYRVLGYSLTKNSNNIDYWAGQEHANDIYKSAKESGLVTDAYNGVITLYAVCMLEEISFDPSDYAKTFYSDTSKRSSYIPSDDGKDESPVDIYIFNPDGKESSINFRSAEHSNNNLSDPMDAQSCEITFYPLTKDDTEMLYKYCTKMEVDEMEVGADIVETCWAYYTVEVTDSNNTTTSLAKKECFDLEFELGKRSVSEDLVDSSNKLTYNFTMGNMKNEKRLKKIYAEFWGDGGGVDIHTSYLSVNIVFTTTKVVCK